MPPWPRSQAIGKALLFGALSALALPPFTLFPVLFVAVPGLLGLIAAAPTRRRAFGLGFCFGFAHHLVGLYWITEAILVRAATFWWLVPFATPLLAALLALFIAVPAALAHRYKHHAGSQVLIFAGIWVLADLARQFIATGFPWNPWGSDLELPGWLGTALIQVASLVGVHGMTLIVLLLASLPRLGPRARALGLAGTLGLLGFGATRLSRPAPPAPGLTAILAQGNIAETDKFDRARDLATFRHYLRLSARGLRQAGSGKAVLIWPETASPFLLAEDPDADAAIAAVTGPTVPALIGAIRFVGQTPYNSLIVLDPPPTIAAIYDKWHLVPFGEFQPHWLPGLQLVDQDGSLGFGSGPRTLHAPGLPPFAPLICYEAVFSGQVVNRADRPAWMVNITNDAWFGNSTGPRQHLAAARLRAVEEGLPLVRAANSGISAGFDAYGRRLGALGIGRSGTLRVPVTGPLPPTLYARFGLWIPLLLALMAVFAGILPLSRATTERR